MKRKERKQWHARNKVMFAQPPLSDLKALLSRADAMYGEKAAVTEKVRGEVVKHSVRELHEKAQALGTALLDMGLGGKNIAVVGENSFDWILAFLTVTGGVGTVIPLDKELTDQELCKLMKKGDVAAVFCSRTFQKAVRLYQNSGAQCPAFMMGEGMADEGIILLADVLARGRLLLDDGERSYIDARVHPQDVAAILFTSGTTGANKGVMLTQHNIATNIEGIAKTVPMPKTTFSVLPMNHIYELNCNILPELYANTVICINDSLRNLMGNFQLYKPGMAMIVPLFLETFYNNIWQEAEKTGRAETLRRAIKLSNFLLRFGIDLRRKLFHSIHEKFGDNLSLLVCGGAPVNPKHVSAMSDFGYTIYIGYGLTEASPIAALNMDGRAKPDSCGPAFFKTEVRIHEPGEGGVGEIWIRGENVTREYYNDAEATRESFTEGWFKTGDYGKVDKGHLLIVGRKKSLIVLDNGKNVHPEEIETFLREEIPYIRELVVFETEKEALGEKQKMIAAAVFISAEEFPDTTLSQLHEMASADIARANKLLPGYKQVRDVCVVTEDFAKTSTKKIIRQKAIDRYRTAQVGAGKR